MDLGNSVHRFDLERKTTMDRSGTLLFNESVKAIQENQYEGESIGSIQNNSEVLRQSDLHANAFGSISNPFLKKNFQKRKTMDLRLLTKANDNFTDFDSEMGSITNTSQNVSSITLNRGPKKKNSILGRKSELFNRNPHFCQLEEKMGKTVNSKERTKSVDKVGEIYSRKQTSEFESTPAWDSITSGKEFTIESTRSNWFGSFP